MYIRVSNVIAKAIMIIQARDGGSSPSSSGRFSPNKSRTASPCRIIGPVLGRWLLPPTPRKVTHHPPSTRQLCDFTVRALCLDIWQCRFSTFIISRLPSRSASSSGRDARPAHLPSSPNDYSVPMYSTSNGRFLNEISISNALERLRSDSLVIFLPNSSQSPGSSEVSAAVLASASAPFKLVKMAVLRCSESDIFNQLGMLIGGKVSSPLL